jgi:hypothetical protein
MKASTSSGNADRQLAAFIRKFSPLDQRLIRAVRNALRKRFPTANELVYDNYNFFVIGYSPTERPSDAIVSMAARANGLGLCFIHGATLPDPNCSSASTSSSRRPGETHHSLGVREAAAAPETAATFGNPVIRKTTERQE